MQKFDFYYLIFWGAFWVFFLGGFGILGVACDISSPSDIHEVTLLSLWVRGGVMAGWVVWSIVWRFRHGSPGPVNRGPLGRLILAI